MWGIGGGGWGGYPTQKRPCTNIRTSTINLVVVAAALRFSVTTAELLEAYDNNNIQEKLAAMKGFLDDFLNGQCEW